MGPVVVSAMTGPANTNDKGAYVVRAPRVTDAIGKTLRRVFVDDKLVPREMTAALLRLDQEAR